MAYQLLKTEEWVRVAVCIAGPTDQYRMIADRPDWRALLEQAFGATQQGIVERSAIYWADQMRPIPLLILHGDADTVVSVAHSRLLHALLPNSVLEIFSGGDHDLTSHTAQVRSLTLEWLLQYL
jgi:dipeptidyl aminopeptidase/acylaminoacyl peptidase